MPPTLQGVPASTLATHLSDHAPDGTALGPVPSGMPYVVCTDCACLFACDADADILYADRYPAQANGHDCSCHQVPAQLPVADLPAPKLSDAIAAWRAAVDQLYVAAVARLSERVRARWPEADAVTVTAEGHGDGAVREVVAVHTADVTLPLDDDTLGELVDDPAAAGALDALAEAALEPGGLRASRVDLA